MRSGSGFTSSIASPSRVGADRCRRRPWDEKRLCIRVNPDVDAVTHPYISTGLSEHKFGIDIAEAEAVYSRRGRLPNVCG